MANKFRSEMVLTFTGDPFQYAMVYDFNSLCLAEKLTGENLLNPNLAGGISASAMRALVFAFLYNKHGHAGAGITIEEAGALMNKGENHKLFAAVGELVQFGVNSDDDSEQGAPPAAAPIAPAKPPSGEEILASLVKPKEAPRADEEKAA
jgi:hypothetical protein